MSRFLYFLTFRFLTYYLLFIPAYLFLFLLVQAVQLIKMINWTPAMT